jgi:indole-3-glycerol phosphate synthase
VYRETPLVKAVSILTDWNYFGMRIEDLQRLKREVGKPVLRKDFMIDEYQVWEARAFGADAILLMACVLNQEQLRRLSELAIHLGMDVLFECHSAGEIGMIPPTARIYGINSREFKTGRKSFRYRASRLIGKLKLFERFGMRDLSTDLAVFRQLIDALPQSAIKVAESGLKPSGIAGVRDLGFDCALIGTALLKSPLGVRRTLEMFGSALDSPHPGLNRASNSANPAGEPIS